MNRNDIAKAIAEDLLNNDVLDENNFSYDTVTILEYVQNIILEHLKDYSLFSLFRKFVCYVAKFRASADNPYQRKPL